MKCLASVVPIIELFHPCSINSQDLSAWQDGCSRYDKETEPGRRFTETESGRGFAETESSIFITETEPRGHTTGAKQRGQTT